MASPNIFQAYLQPPKTVADYSADLNKQDSDALTLQTQRQALTDQNALRAAVQTFGNDPSANLNALQKAGLYSQAQGYQKALYDNQKTQSDIGLNTAKSGEQTALAGQHTQETHFAAIDKHSQELQGVSSPDDFMSWIKSGVGNGTLDLTKAAALAQTLQQDPSQFPALKQKMLATAIDVKTAYTQQQENARSAANNQTSIATTGMNNAQSGANTAANNRTSVQTTGMNNATSRANNTANITKDYTVSGINPDGTPMANTQSMVDAIGKYQVQPPSGMALRNPRMAAIMDQVTSQYAGQDADHPSFDATQYGARQVAAKSFSTGKDGQQVQAANTALNHIATLTQLAQAQSNGNLPLFNQLANRFASETGQPAPTNLQAAITMVGPEISKAVIGSGGGQGDRDKVDSVLTSLSKGSPAQAAGALGTITDLFGGRLQEVGRTYQRTTGRSDFGPTFLSPAAQTVLSARSGTPTAGALPAGAAIDAEIARRAAAKK